MIVVKGELVISAYVFRHTQTDGPADVLYAIRFVVRFRGQECPRHTSKSWPHTQAENEVPQPHDFVAWGFTKTNPCCISVS